MTVKSFIFFSPMIHYNQTTGGMFVDVRPMIAKAFSERATDIHLSVGICPHFRIDGELVPKKEYGELSSTDIYDAVRDIFDELGMRLDKRQKEIDFSFTVAGNIRVRGNFYYERGNPALALRLIPKRIRTIEELKLPSILKDIADQDFGLILVAGPTGSGKSTTIAAMIDFLNERYPYHIITIEDPIEYVFENKRSIIHQRELGKDTESFVDGLKYALRQDPDVILVGEMRDLETMRLALTAAETGHIVFATVHTNSAASAPERIVDVFPAHQQRQVALQLANTIRAVIYQRLLPKVGGGMIAILEIMIGTPGVSNLIREGKLHQLDSLIQAGSKYGMIHFDDALIEAYRKGLISKDTVLNYARSPEEVQKRLW